MNPTHHSGMRFAPAQYIVEHQFQGPGLKQICDAFADYSQKSQRKRTQMRLQQFPYRDPLALLSALWSRGSFDGIAFCQAVSPFGEQSRYSPNSQSAGQSSEQNLDDDWASCVLGMCRWMPF